MFTKSAKKKIKALFSPLFVYQGNKAIQQQKNSNSTLRSEVEFALGWNYRFLGYKPKVSIKPIQVKEELLRFLKEIKGRNLDTVLEIGTAKGGVLYLLSRISNSDAKIISIDLPEGKFGGGYPKWKVSIFQEFTTNDQDIHLIRKNSHHARTLKETRGVLDGDKIDLLFIDGDHSYEGVKSDFDMYAPLVKDGGIIAFHDIVSGPRENVGGVPRLWREIKEEYQNNTEFVKDWEQGGYGIGMVYKE